MRPLALISEDHRWYPIVIATNVIVTTFLAVFSAVSTMIADPAIQGELSLSDTQAIWLTTLYLLGINLTVPCGNWFAMHFGFKRMYAWGVTIFTFGSLLVALSNNFFMLASGRLIEGIGGGFIFPVGLSLIVQSLPKERVALGVNLYIAGAFGAGLGLGIPLSGYVTQFTSWREIFLIIAVVGTFTAGSCWVTRPRRPEIDRVPFDYFGYLTFATFIITFLIALTMGPIKATAEGWRTPYILAFFFIAAISLVSCIMIERRHPNPLFPPALFKDPIFSVSLAAMFLLGMATFASVSISIQYMLNGLGYEKYEIGKIASIYGIVIGVCSVASSYLSKIIAVPILIFTGLFLLIFSYFYNNELSWLTGVTQVRTILIIRGMGIGLSLGPTTLMALYGIPQELKSSAATVLTFFRQVGGTYGGTLISIFSIRQTIFHAARFGEQANSQLPAYKKTVHNIYDKYPDLAQAKAAIVKNILTQAYIQGLNDALIVFGYVTSVVAFILMILIGYKYWKSRSALDHQ